MSWTYRRRLQIIWSIVSAAFLAGCGVHGSSGALPGLNPSSAQTSSRTFHFTHAAQKFKVPQGVTQLTITADGAQGGGPKKSSQGPPGALGAEITATFSVTSGELLLVHVGSKGILSKGRGGLDGGGFNGGGGASAGAYGGGGSSDVRTAGDKLTDRILVAAGGGGTGDDGSEYDYKSTNCCSYVLLGGAGGVGGARTAGDDGGPGQDGGHGGAGGSQQVGGAGGLGQSGFGSSFGSPTGSCEAVNGGKGKLFSGGEGAGSGCGPVGGGGGGGYYGGGGGGGGGYSKGESTGSAYSAYGGGGGGGGGSSFIETSATHVHRTAGGAPTGDGLVVIKW
jgi:hypothetical protein